ncbi:MAG: response regulator [Chthoniobacterales bacterium]
MLAEAETATRNDTPELIVVDVDPPQRGTVASLKRLGSAAPDARVIIIGADDASALAEQPNRPAALHFMKKPFAVAEFSALVRDLLEAGPSRAGARLRDLKLVDLLVLQAVARDTTILQIDAADGRTGEIHFTDGKITHAVVAGHMGRVALRELLRWRGPRVRELDRRVDAPRTIHAPWTAVLLEALDAPPETEQALVEDTAAAGAKPPTPLTGKKILVIDDTELLLIFVEEILSTAETALEIITASSGTKGVEKALAENPDLILLDYSLPDITGDEVCRRLLADEATARLPVIMMSGHVPEMLAVAEEFENVIAAIPKPFLSSALVELIEATLAELPAITARKRRRRKALAQKLEAAKPPTTHNGADEHDSPASPPPDSGGSALPVPEERVEAAPEPVPPLPIEVEEPPAPPPPIAEAAPAIESPPITPPPPPPLGAQSTALVAPKRTDVTHAVISGGPRNAVVVTLPLEVVSLQFSPALEMRALRARPVSPTISLHVTPETMPGAVVPEAPFDVVHVDLNARGQIDTMRVAPTKNILPPLQFRTPVPLVGMAVLPAIGGPAMELMPAPSAALRMQLTALFELVGVELSSGFSVGHLVLKWRGGQMRITQEANAHRSGLVFDTAQILLDRAARIAEILLELVA